MKSKTIVVTAMLLLSDLGCGSEADNGDTSTDADSDVDSDTDVDADTDSDSDSDSDSDCSIFPSDNPWNTPIDKLKVHPNSDQYINSIGPDITLHPDFGTYWKGAPIGIPYMVVDDSTPMQEVEFEYYDDSDLGPYPIPDNPLIEGGPKSKGDRHIVMLNLASCVLYELYCAWPPGEGKNPSNKVWYAGSGAIFDLRSNDLRKDYWTSADAAGLPIFPGLVRYEEAVEKGEIKHALRFTVSRTQRGFIHPATHYASSDTDPNLPPMGLRFRLKNNYDIKSFPSEARAILQALKTYGMFVADNGSDWYISGAPNDKWSDDNLSTIGKVPGSAFEAVYTGEIIY